MKNFILSTCIVFALTGYSQTGPGGVGNSSNNVIWLNGDIYTLATSPNISTWLDQSGNGNNFSQATASKQPSVVTYSGFKGLRFDGNDFITNNGIAALNTNTNTHYVVYNGYRPNHIGFLFNAAYTQNNSFLTTYRQNGNIRSWVLNSSLGIVDNTTTNSSAFQIVSSVWDGAGQTFTTYKDGTSIGSKSGANGNPTGNYLNVIGASSNGSYRFDGDMSELIVYNTVLNSAQRTIVDNYLSSKFATAISNDKYSYDATHKYQVIGIGAEADGNNLTARGAGIVQLSSGAMSNGDYIFIGHNNTNLTTITNDVPPSIIGGSRLSRTWRVDVTGTPGNIDVTFDVSSLTLPTGSYYLLVDADGVFNAGATSYGPFVDVAGLVTFSGVSFADGDYFSLASGSNAGITSVKTGDWSSASTWDCSCVPTLTDTVTISAGHNVTISSNSIINDLTVNGTLTASAVVVSVRSDLVVGATGNALFKSLIFDGSVAQNFTNLSGNTLSMEVLKVNNGSSLSLFSGNINVTKSLYTTSGQMINVSSTITLTSNATSTAVLYGSSGYVGQFILQRYISQRNAGWGDLSSPVSNNHLSDWDSNPSQTAHELYMCGVDGVSGSCGGWNSVYSFDAATQTYPAITDTSYVLTPGTGIELWLADDEDFLYNTTFDSRGTPNYGNIAVPVLNSWNLVGNPYQAFVNFNSLTKPTINPTYYIWSTASGTYDAKTAGQIPPHQGFYVESVGAGTLTFTEASKNGNNSSLFYKTAFQDDVEPYTFTEASLKLTNLTNGYNHTLKLRINNLANINHDYYDASLLPSKLTEAPSIYSYSANNNKKLVINSFDYNSEVLLPVAIEAGVSGKYTIEAINFENMANHFTVIELTDTKTGQVYKLNNQKTIELSLNEADNGERFLLKLSNQSSSNTIGGLTDVNIYKSNEITVIELDDATQQYTISVYNALGQKIINDQQVNNTNKVELQNNLLNKGLVIIKVSSNNGELVKKLTY